MNKQYPKEKFGAETEVEVDTSTGSVTSTREEIYNGGVTRRLKISEDSIKIEDEKSIVEKVFDAYKQQKEGKILGFSVNGEAYHPQTLKVSRIIIKTIRFADK